MIIYYIVQAFIGFMNAMVSWLPTVSELPLGMDSALSTVFGYWNGFMEVLWPLQILWVCVLWYYGLKVTLVGLKFVFGARIV